jgi:hypothetical protein
MIPVIQRWNIGSAIDPAATMPGIIAVYRFVVVAIIIIIIYSQIYIIS